MTAESNPPLPPEPVSVKAFVEKQWIAIYRMTADGFPTKGMLRLIDSHLEKHRDLIDQGSLKSEYDWQKDYDVAMHLHRWNKGLLPRQETLRSNQLEYWKEHTKRINEYGEKISLAAFSTMTVLHGAVAVGALNIIAAKTPVSVAAVHAAKWAIPFALIGMVLLAVGHIIVFYFGNIMAGRISRRFPSAPRSYRFAAFGRYWNKHRHLIVKGELLVYASIVWFFIYCFILFLILVSD